MGTKNKESCKTLNKRLLLLGVISLVMIVAIMTGCTPSGEDCFFTVKPQQLTMEVGQTQQLAIDGNIGDAQVTWSSSAPSVATVDAGGNVTAVAPGSARVTAVVTVEGKEYSASASIYIPQKELDKVSIPGDSVPPDERVFLFEIDKTTGAVTTDNLEGRLAYAGTGNTEVYFASGTTQTHAKNWEMTGRIEKQNASTSLFLSFGVIDENGKSQWFCILNASSMSLQRDWNWYNNRFYADGVNVIDNAAATAFFGHEVNTNRVLNYRIVLEADILKVYFGNDENELALAWNLDLTEAKFGGFALDSSYQLAINTVDPCPMSITGISVKTNNDKVERPEKPVEPEPVDGSFYVDNKSVSITADPEKGTLTYLGAQETELFFKANKTDTHAKNWEMTGTITKADMNKGVFFSIGVKDANGKDQWFCILNASSIALQRYWNWYNNRVLPNGTTVMENAAATAFFGHEVNTSAVLNYRIVLEADILKVYFGNDENELALAWNLDLTTAQFGGFASGSSYQLAFNSVDPCAMMISDITVATNNVTVEQNGLTWEYGAISDWGGEALYDRGKTRMVSSYIAVKPGTTITLDAAPHVFILYGYTYDAATDTYTYCGSNSYIDCDPNSSSNWNTTYTFGETTTFGNGNTAPENLYVRIVIKNNTDGGADIPEETGDLITIAEPDSYQLITDLSLLNNSDGNFRLAEDVVCTATITGFTGNLDGNGKTIRTTVTVFDTIDSSTTIIENLKIVLTQDLADEAILLARARNIKEINNVEIISENDAKLTGLYGSNWTGAVVAYSVNATIVNCVNRVDVIVGNLFYTGGIVGAADEGGTTVITGCVNYGDIEGDEAGGIIGRVRQGAKAYITDCTNNGNIVHITHSWAAGGILGRINEAGCYAEIANCTNNGSVTATSANRSGSIIGFAGGDSAKIVGCTNNGTVGGSPQNDYVGSDPNNIVTIED